MFVYLLFNGTCKRTTPVSLDLEKCMPCVGTYTEGTVDPPLWYKVLVLDSILVDCDRRTVFWTCEKYHVDIQKECLHDGIDTEEVRGHFADKERMFKERNCVDLDPTLGELFETAEEIFHNLSPEIFDREGNVSTYKDLMKMLHVYILPHVEFQLRYRNVVQHVLDKIEKEHENIEMLIAMNVQSKKNIEEFLKKEREYLLTEDGVSNILNNISKNEDFINCLLKHTEKDIRRLEDNLSMLTDKITPLKNATDETSARQLADTRAERDKVSRGKERIIVAREELVNGLILHKRTMVRRIPKKRLLRSQSVRVDRFADGFEGYEREARNTDNLSNEIKQHINIKIKLSSIREAVCLTLKEIQTDGSSFGYNRKNGSIEIEADLFDSTKKPENWTTLKEHVKAYLQTNQSDFKIKHDEFCTRFKENCKAIQERAKRDYLINCGTLGTGKLALSIGSSQSHQKEAMRFSTRWLFGSVAREDCEALCKQIYDHILNITDEIVLEIQGEEEIPRNLHSRVYICYEEHISEELMPVLCKLFEQSYRIQCEELSAWIEKYAETELDSIYRTLKCLFPDVPGRNASLEQTGDKIARKRSTSLTSSLIGRVSGTSGSLSQTFSRTLKILSTRDRQAFGERKTSSQSLNTRFMSAFENFYATIQEEDMAVSIFSKLRHLTLAVQSAERTFTELCNRNDQSIDMSADCILDILILLICRLGPNRLLKLYTHVNLILHLSPYFLQGSINEYSLVSLTGAFQHLFERKEMHASHDETPKKVKVESEHSYL